MVSPKILKLNAEIAISVAFRISHQSIFCNKFHHNQLLLSLSVFLSSGTLSRRQRDLRMFFIYKLCGVENEFEKKVNEP